jgi:hypothetical protein
VDPSTLIPTGLEFFKELLNQAKKLKSTELIQLIGEAQEAFLQLRNENAELQDKVRSLDRELAELREHRNVPLEFNDNVYWKRDSDEGHYDGPYCSTCWDRDKKLIRLQFSDGYFACDSCKGPSIDPPRKPGKSEPFRPPMHPKEKERDEASKRRRPGPYF